MKKFDPLMFADQSSNDWQIAFACDQLISAIALEPMPAEFKLPLIASAAGERDLCMLRAVCALPWDG